MRIQGTFSAHSGNVQCAFKERSVHIQGTFSAHSEDVQCTFRERSVHSQGAFSGEKAGGAVDTRGGVRWWLPGNIRGTFRER